MLNVAVETRDMLCTYTPPNALEIKVGVVATNNSPVE